MWKDITTSHQPVEVRLCCCGGCDPVLSSREACAFICLRTRRITDSSTTNMRQKPLCQLPPPEVITCLIILHRDHKVVVLFALRQLEGGGGVGGCCGTGRNLPWFFLRNVGGNRFVGVNTVLMLVLHDGAVARGEMVDVELKKKGRVVFIAWFAVWKGSALLHDFYLSAVGTGFVLDDLGDVRPFHRLSCF